MSYYVGCSLVVCGTLLFSFFHGWVLATRPFRLSRPVTFGAIALGLLGVRLFTGHPIWSQGFFFASAATLVAVFLWALVLTFLFGFVVALTRKTVGTWRWH